jgi:hypothetical protein
MPDVIVTTKDAGNLDVDFRAFEDAAAPGVNISQVYVRFNGALVSLSNLFPVDVPHLTLGTDEVSVAGTVDDGVAVADPPVRIGARAVNAPPTALQNGQTADLITDLLRRLIIEPHANPEETVDGSTADITGTGNTAVIAAQAGYRFYITEITVSNSHASQGTWVNIKDGTTTKHTVYLSKEGGAVIPFPGKGLRLSVNTALNVACEIAANVRASAVGYRLAI